MENEPLKLSWHKDDNTIEVHLPIYTASEANSTEHWSDKHKRHKKQKKIVTLMFNLFKNKLSLPCHVKLVRYGPRKLDKYDNLPMSMKYILDTVCAFLVNDFRPGLADSDDRIFVAYDQVVSKHYGVKILLQFKGDVK